MQNIQIDPLLIGCITIAFMMVIVAIIYEKWIVRKPKNQNWHTARNDYNTLRDLIESSESLSEIDRIELEIDKFDIYWKAYLPGAEHLTMTGQLYERWFEKRHQLLRN